jgi:acyl-coenzyme A thioesterase PaaI-like protein
VDLNPFGVVHAGAMLWFADLCAADAGKSESSMRVSQLALTYTR